MNILSWEEIPRMSVISVHVGISILIGYYLAVYQKDKVVDELKNSIKDLRKALKLKRGIKDGGDNADTDPDNNRSYT